MTPTFSARPPSASSTANEDIPRFRTGTVGRMVRMPVATLRIWERRYRLTPTTTASGHRLYSAADVHRIALLKQLTDMGHAIGTIAALDVEQLRQVAAVHVSTVAGTAQASVPRRAPWRIAVVGDVLTRRLQRPVLLRRLGSAPETSGPFESLTGAVEAQAGQGIDALLVETRGLHKKSLAELQAAASALGARRVGVLYGYAAESVCNAFTAAGIALLHEPQTDLTLADWLRGLRGDPPAKQMEGLASVPGLAYPGWLDAAVVPPRRYDDATLADFAGLSSTISCECPRHVVELLMQLSRFETYSSECEQLSPADAALHAFLQQTSGAARHLFEAALEQLAIHEGLILGT